MNIAKKIEYFIFRGLSSFVRALPIGAVRAFARSIAWIVFYVLRIRRNVTVMQIRRALPEKTEKEVLAIAYGSFVNLVTTICELLWSPNITRTLCNTLVDHQDLDVLMQAHKRGSGVIFLCGHFGNWEWLIGSLPLGHGLPTAAIVRPMQNLYVDALVETIRENAGVQVILAHRAVRETIAFIRARGIVGILTDQSAPRDSFFVPYFGIPASTYAGPAHFALKTGAAVIMAHCIRQKDGNYIVKCEEIPTNDLHDASEENLRTLTLRHVQALERVVRLYPEQWLWQHKRWKHAPADGNGL